MAAPLYSVADYVSALQALLPRGLAWPRDTGTTLAATFAGLSPSFQRVNADANQLLVDAFPATVDDLLEEWNATLGLPGIYGYTGRDLPTQQRQVVAALIDSGGQSSAYFIALAASLRLSIQISGYRPARVTDAVNAPMYGTAWSHAWLVHSDIVADYGNLRLLFERYKPAHTVIVWSVPAGDVGTESGADLTTESGDPLALEY
jgi:uncharacterized protein YmfQ (DUF2313 family)